MEKFGGYLDAEFVGYLGLVEKAKEMLADEAAGRLRPEAIPPRAEDIPIAELLLLGGVNHPQILELALSHSIEPRMIHSGARSSTNVSAAGIANASGCCSSGVTSRGALPRSC